MEALHASVTLVVRRCLPRPVVWWLVASLLLLALSACHRPPAGETGDAKVISALQDAGSDLSKPHQIEFFLLFPDAERAQAATTELMRRGYDTAPPEKSPEHETWTVYASRRMLPELDLITASTQDLDALAARHGGDFDGWETAIVK